MNRRHERASPGATPLDQKAYQMIVRATASWNPIGANAGRRRRELRTMSMARLRNPVATRTSVRAHATCAPEAADTVPYGGTICLCRQGIGRAILIERVLMLTDLRPDLAYRVRVLRRKPNRWCQCDESNQPSKVRKHDI